MRIDHITLSFGVFALVCLFVLIGWLFLLTSLARVQSLNESGITLRTLAGQKHLAWTDLRAPVRFSSRNIWLHISLDFRHVSFFTSRRGYAVVGRLEESRRIAEAISQHIRVAESQVL